ncbi:exosortase family protein XrtF [Empedobacter falsenii]|uniref:Exosortase family protein XrtF n=1 Tax=Empedobacter falsenii TaxID=343874 RepID=A0AAW7DEY6_9FLAO|nr:exosortase family protein XrtF [Empedobacter falsenii]MDM1550233.1 exosortase family protein XrtF [Empedobacter falsenii]
MKEFKPLLLFLARFLGTYIILSLAYKLYLDQYLPHNNPDPFTKLTSDVTAFGLNKCGFFSFSNIAENQPWMRLVVDGQVASIVNEGCNAISILIIFISFIVAFYTNFKQTFLFILSGLAILFVMNISRIMLLNYIFRYHNEYGKMAHDYLFPAIIYGSIVVLWIVWIKFFVTKYNKQNAK